MAFDEEMAGRVRSLLDHRFDVEDKRMFSGVAFMVGGNMACAVMSDGGLLVRMDPDEVPEALGEPHVSEFGREGARPMSGFVRVDPDGLAADEDLARWVDTGAARAASLPPK